MTRNKQTGFSRVSNPDNPFPDFPDTETRWCWNGSNMELVGCNKSFVDRSNLNCFHLPCCDLVERDGVIE